MGCDADQGLAGRAPVVAFVSDDSPQTGDGPTEPLSRSGCAEMVKSNPRLDVHACPCHARTKPHLAEVV